MPKSYLVLLSLGLPLLLGACAQRLPPSTVASPLPSSSESSLLRALAHCGAADSLACAQIHLALAQGYLRQQPLNRTNVAAAHSELQMAAQNPELAKQTDGWRRLTASWLQLAARPESPGKFAAQNSSALTAQIARLTAENAEQKAKLAQLNSLLQAEAQKTLEKKAK
ncbi:hypothetical protein [Acidithiobacillus sp. AMEEHan]|uniref:hypothetical protein n=1 Tax=Acidithiobacillus sp. AMEEHan TaxID=2994951 RepID=UPI0027E4DE58|nr:hypothetical protein [Acidithiobacillus sp. AMEEHan]